MAFWWFIGGFATSLALYAIIIACMVHKKKKQLAKQKEQIEKALGVSKVDTTSKDVDVSIKDVDEK